MNYFLFQCLPENYRLIDALHDGETEIWWRTTSHESIIAVGDKVFLWQARGQKPSFWGLHAIAEVSERPRYITASDFDHYWVSDLEKDTTSQHTRLHIVERARKGSHLAQSVVARSPELKDRGLFKGVMGVNFRLDEREARVLESLWRAHAQIAGEGPQKDKPVTSDLEGIHDESARELLDRTSARLCDRSLEELGKLLSLPNRQRPDELVSIKVAGRPRDPVVVAYARVRAGNRCEVPDCSHSLFTSKSGLPFVEVHHIQPLGKYGPDAIGNVACLCPSHHREAHHGTSASEMQILLQKVRKDLP